MLHGLRHSSDSHSSANNASAYTKKPGSLSSTLARFL
jgi:hypothetical protein